MADYELSVRVNKSLYSDLQVLQENLVGVAAEAQYAGDVIGSLSGKAAAFSASKFDQAVTVCEEYVAELKVVEKAQEKVNEVDMGKATGEFASVKDSSKKCFDTIKEGAGKSGGFLKGMGSKIKGLIGKINVFGLLEKGLGALVDSMKKGFENLVQYSGDYSTTMGGLKSQMSQFENSLAAAFEPVVTAVVPYITQMVSWLTTAADSMGQFLAAMQGKSTYTKATKQVGEYANTLDTASEAARRSLSAFDELNTLESISSEGVVIKTTAFETGDVSSEALDLMVSFVPILTSLEELKVAIEPFVNGLFVGLEWFLDKILVPLGAWTINEAVPVFLDLLSSAIEFLTGVVAGLVPYGDWLWSNLLQPIAEWTGEKVIKGVSSLTEVLSEFSSWCASEEENISLMSSTILGLLAGIVTYYTVERIPLVIAGISSGLKNFLAILSAGISPIMLAALAVGTLAAGIIYLASNWDKLSGAQKSIAILGALAAAAIAAAVAVAIFHTSWSVGIAAAAIVGGLALLGLTAACLKSGGNTSERVAISFYDGNDFSGSPLPQLAEGAVIHGGKPFAAILGDQKFGQTNVETPLQTMVDAFKIAIADREASSGSNYTFVAQLDGKTIFKETVKQSHIYQKATGHSAFVF